MLDKLVPGRASAAERPASATGGVIPMSLEGRCRHVRERLISMSDAEREWRKQFLKDQILAPDEPRYVPEYYRQLINPIRRLSRWPLDTLFEKLQPVLGFHRATFWRQALTPVIYATILSYWVYYHWKYHSNTWEKARSPCYMTSRRVVLPGEPDYPLTSEKHKPWHYDSRDFTQRNVFRGGLY